MEGLSIEFIKSGAVLDVASKVENFGTIVQNGMVNIGTVAGSDPLYATRGTQLYSAGILGALIAFNSAYHASNFAALDTTFFLKSSDYEEVNYERVKLVEMRPVTYTGTQLNINVRFEGEAGTIVGKQITN